MRPNASWVPSLIRLGSVPPVSLQAHGKAVTANEKVPKTSLCSRLSTAPEPTERGFRHLFVRSHPAQIRAGTQDAPNNPSPGNTDGDLFASPPRTPQYPRINRFSQNRGRNS